MTKKARAIQETSVMSVDSVDLFSHSQLDWIRYAMLG